MRQFSLLIHIWMGFMLLALAVVVTDLFQVGIGTGTTMLYALLTLASLGAVWLPWWRS